MNRLVLVLAGLLGAAGVAAAAASAHLTGGGPLAQAAEVMMIHAAALTGLAALAARTGGVLVDGLALVMGLAAALFGSDVALLVFAGHHLFPMAAPIGGSVLIGGWLTLAGLAAIGRIGGRSLGGQ